MLEWVATPYGEMVPKFNGTLLASKVDPLKEARTWVVHHRPQIESADRHFLLGVAGGHHAAELSRQYPSKEFLCVEYVADLSISVAYAQLRTAVNVEMIVGQDLKNILKNERVQKALGGLFTILTHQPSYGVAKDYYDGLRDALTGRSWRAFNGILKFRSAEEMFLNEINFTPKEDDLVSAKDVVSFVEGREGEKSDDEMIWLTLGELIK
jgi:hypothetical protein